MIERVIAVIGLVVSVAAIWFIFRRAKAPYGGAKRVSEAQELDAALEARNRKYRRLLADKVDLEERIGWKVREYLNDGVNTVWCSANPRGPCRSCGGEIIDHYLYEIGGGVEIRTCQPVEPYQPVDDRTPSGTIKRTPEDGGDA